MRQYDSLSGLLMDRDNYPSGGRLYIEKAKVRDIQNARYWLMSRKEIKIQGYGKNSSGRIPAALQDCGVEHFMGLWTFEYIVDLKMGNCPGILSAGSLSAGALMFVEAALLYYLQHQRFMH